MKKFKELTLAASAAMMPVVSAFYSHTASGCNGNCGACGFSCILPSIGILGIAAVSKIIVHQPPSQDE